MSWLTIKLTKEQREELIEMRDEYPLPYVRERAAALLKVANGQCGQDVAAKGLLKVRHRTTVSEWVHRYEREGITGLLVKPGRGRKPAFSPSVRGSRERP